MVSRYAQVWVEADRARCPAMLGKGNNVDGGICKHDTWRHFVVFDDPSSLASSAAFTMPSRLLRGVSCS